METALILQALDFDNNTQIYIASGEIYGSERRLSAVRAAFPNTVSYKFLLCSPGSLSWLADSYWYKVCFRILFYDEKLFHKIVELWKMHVSWGLYVSSIKVLGLHFGYKMQHKV